MKNFLLVVIVAIVLICSMETARAQNNGVGGLLIGLGSGAVVGHAIAGNAEGAVVGSFIGGTLGVLIGSEMDRAQSLQTRNVYRQNGPYYDSRQRHDQRRSIEDVTATKACREARIPAEVNGRGKKVYATVCREAGRWVVQDDGPHAKRTVVIERTVYTPQPNFVILSSFSGRHHRWSYGDSPRHGRPRRSRSHSR
jgi:outer membrane lipoprotein SlyB